MDNFYIYLSSNTPNQAITGNSIANFITKLPKKINLSEEWEVALTEISYTKSWYNIFEDQQIRIAVDEYVSEPKLLKAGLYDLDNLIYKLNEIISLCIIPSKIENSAKINRLTLEPQKISTNYILSYPSIIYDGPTNKIKIKSGDYLYEKTKTNKPIHLILPNFISQILGISYVKSDLHHISGYKNYKENNIIIIDKSNQYAEVNMNAGIHSLLLYCDLVQPVLVGHREVQLLRNVEIPNNIPFGQQIVLKYQTPYYHPLLRSEFDSIEIDTKDDSNRQIEFQFGRTSLTLHFRKIQPNVAQSIFKLLQ